ncbi:MAG TPA: RNB domain-containing ribonuclease [Longimicrobiaceae bacterium]|nr:RNB domain-containing ribonuclease [Longimicrobiaceae bacterium]
MPADRRRIERAFDRAREELEVRTEFPPEALAEAERAARERDPSAAPGYADLTGVPFVTIDPPGSRDLDQALHLERAGEGLRLRYAIANVGFWVDRGGAVEREAWRRGVTFYAPDRRVPLYPPVLGEEAASLLPDGVRPAVVFTIRTDARAEPVEVRVERARVLSRAQLTYADAQAHAEGEGGGSRGEPWSESLLLLREFGERRREREAERGGTSLPIVAQHVQQDAATRLGYALEYEVPRPSERWNEQVSLLTGHVAARRMLEARTGILRVMPPAEPEEVQRFHVAARALGFDWPKEATYAEFMRSLDVGRPHVAALVWQARRLNRGADYLAFDGELPDAPEHAALAMPYAHVTAPLRRLCDRYALDLLAGLEAGRRPGPAEVAALRKLPPVMDGAQARAGRLERRAVDIAEAWTLRGCEGRTYPAVVLGFRGAAVEVQVEEPPVRALAAREGGEPRLEPGEHVTVRLAEADVEDGEVRFQVPA